MTYVPLGRTRISTGEALRVAVDAGTLLHVAHGAVTLREPPAWLAQSVLMPGTRLEEGQMHELARAGWIEIVADRDTEVAQYAPAGLVTEALGLVSRVVQALRTLSWHHRPKEPA